MIMIGIGANLQSPEWGAPINTCGAALRAFSNKGVTVVRRSRWYRSTPIPMSNQPPFVNGVVEVTTNFRPKKLLFELLALEEEFGRKRDATNAARVLDLDLLTYHSEEMGSDAGLILPHPRMHERAFVLRPLIELAPRWNHPILRLSVSELIARLQFGQIVEPI